MKIKRTLVGPLYQLLESTKSIKCAIRTAYNITKNKKVLFSEIEAIQEASKPVGDLAAFEKERVELCKKYCRKSENGSPIIENRSFVFDPEEKAKLDEDIKPLFEKYPNINELSATFEQMLVNFMEEEIDLGLVQFSLSSLPDDSFSVEDIELLSESGLLLED